MRVYLVAYYKPSDMENCVGAAIVEVPVTGWAKRAAEDLGISLPGHVAIETELEARTVPAELIGKLLTRAQIAKLVAQKKPPATSVRRRA